MIRDYLIFQSIAYYLSCFLFFDFEYRLSFMKINVETVYERTYRV